MIPGHVGLRRESKNRIRVQMLCPYHKQQTIPLMILVLVGVGIIIATFLNRGFHPILLTLLPGFAFTIFYCLCIFGKQRQAWHHWVWKVSIWWSGIWLALFFVGLFAAVPFSPFLLILPAAWTAACGINPFVAVGLHLMAWACSLDASRNEILVGTGD